MDRSVIQVITGHQQREGGGFVVRRPFPSRGIPNLDPFLMLDELGPVDYAPGEAIGAPDHPHRGFETVSYILEGEAAHADVDIDYPRGINDLNSFDQDPKRLSKISTLALNRLKVNLTKLATYRRTSNC